MTAANSTLKGNRYLHLGTPLKISKSHTKVYNNGKARAGDNPTKPTLVTMLMDRNCLSQKNL